MMFVYNLRIWEGRQEGRQAGWLWLTSAVSLPCMGTQSLFCPRVMVQRPLLSFKTNEATDCNLGGISRYPQWRPQSPAGQPC